LWPPSAHSSAKPLELVLLRQQVAPKISAAAGPLKGASARYTNLHFGHSQHHEAPRLGSRRKIVLQLVNAPW
jgi:hypothetical protein